MGDLALFDQAAPNVPAHIKAMFGDAPNADLSGGVNGGFPILSIKGKVWHLVQGGDRTLIAGEDGEPRASIEVVIVKANPHISKIFYPEGYTEGSDEKPTCYSFDGVTPGADAAVKQADKCAICPRNVWGSRITENGAKGKECSDSRRLAVAPAGDLENPMLLRVPAATLGDLRNYGDLLSKRGTPYQALVTKIGFDHTVAHPKLKFTPVRWLTPEEVVTVANVMKGSAVAQIIGDVVATPAAASDPAEAALDALGAPPVVAPVEAPKAAKAKKSEATVEEVAEVVAKPKAAGFGPSAATETKPPAPTPAAPAKRDHSALLAEATASLDDVLATLDD